MMTNYEQKLEQKYSKTWFIWAGIALLLIGQITFNAYLWHRSRPTHDGVIENLVIQASEGLLNPLPIDAQSGKGYVASERLVFPAAPHELTGMMYSHYSAVDSSAAELHFTTNTIMSAAKSKLVRSGVDPERSVRQNLEAVFNELPKLQACSRGVRILIDKPLDSTAEDLKFFGSKKLSDGRTLYLYSETGCAHDAMNSLAQHIKQVESY